MTAVPSFFLHALWLWVTAIAETAVVSAAGRWYRGLVIRICLCSVGAHSVGRAWRLSRAKALSVVAPCLLLSSLAGAQEIDVDVALVLACDVSASMDAGEVRIARESHAAAIESPEVVDAIGKGFVGRITVAYIEFASTAKLRIDWTLVDGP